MFEKAFTDFSTQLRPFASIQVFSLILLFSSLFLSSGNFGRTDLAFTRRCCRDFLVFLFQARNPQSSGQEVSGSSAARRPTISQSLRPVVRPSLQSLHCFHSAKTDPKSHFNFQCNKMLNLKSGKWHIHSEYSFNSARL